MKLYVEIKMLDEEISYLCKAGKAFTNGGYRTKEYVRLSENLSRLLRIKNQYLYSYARG